MGRKEDNDALNDLGALVHLLLDIEPKLRRVLVRNRLETGQKIHKENEFGDEAGTQSLEHSDPTGETAIYFYPAEWRLDGMKKTITAMAAEMRNWRVMLEWLEHGIRRTDVTKRADETIPACLACGDLCYGVIRSGFDDKCYMRYRRGDWPDRHKFIADVKAERQGIEKSEVVADDKQSNTCYNAYGGTNSISGGAS